jgi:hypothetical protein
LQVSAFVKTEKEKENGIEPNIEKNIVRGKVGEMVKRYSNICTCG